ncbi:MAG: prepilin-type N-terminal cleavage/methylation domain-containing protein [Planctomycetales bacterium]|nr:prepilin-type N-terminal cleavage/methylation domain-containing protein [Planctomycetales bacterium]
MNDKNKTGFTVIEVMMALVILAMLTTAVAFAFDASIKNYQANQGIYQAVNTARAALLRITNDLRTAQAVTLIADEPNTQVSLLTSGGGDITYRFDVGTLYLVKDSDNDGDFESYALCKNVVAMTFNGTDKYVTMVITVTDGAGKVQTLAAAALVRRNL